MKTTWNASLYDQKHDFVSKFGGSLVDVLAPKEGERILDVGCGTGDLAHEITSHGAIVVGADASADMIFAAQQKYPMIKFMTQDAEAMHFANEFDAVFSNAALHWIKQQKNVIQNIYNAIKPHGRFVAEMGGHGNIASIVSALKQSMAALNFSYNEDDFPWYFPTVEEYQTLLENAGFKVETIKLYERPTPLQGEDGLRNWLEMFSFNILKQFADHEKEQVYAKCEALLKPNYYRENEWITDYWRLRFVAYKSAGVLIR